MAAEYKIRRAHPSDAGDIAAAHIDSIRSVGPQFYPGSIVEDWSEGLKQDAIDRRVHVVSKGRIARFSQDDDCFQVHRDEFGCATVRCL